MADKYYVYIVLCSDSTLYTGYTTDVSRRVAEHNGMLPGGAKYTKLRAPVQLKHVESFASRSEAMKREFYIKSLNRADKLALIKKKLNSSEVDR